MLTQGQTNELKATLRETAYGIELEAAQEAFNSAIARAVKAQDSAVKHANDVYEASIVRAKGEWDIATTSAHARYYEAHHD